MSRKHKLRNAKLGIDKRRKGPSAKQGGGLPGQHIKTFVLVRPAKWLKKLKPAIKADPIVATEQAKTN